MEIFSSMNLKFFPASYIFHLELPRMTVVLNCELVLYNYHHITCLNYSKHPGTAQNEGSRARPRDVRHVSDNKNGIIKYDYEHKASITTKLHIYKHTDVHDT